jgi:hypothetical protein
MIRVFLIHCYYLNILQMVGEDVLEGVIAEIEREAEESKKAALDANADGMQM